MTEKDMIKEIGWKINIDLTKDQCEQFYIYYKELIEWNKVMNLTGITEFNEILVKHFEDSLMITNYFEMDRSMKILDLGTGAGLPGIPLKIAYPDITIVLVDSLNKRVQFLNHIADKLNLNNIFCVHGRAEELGHNECYRENFDLCVSRAVANMAVLSEYCLPFVKVNGHFISYKAIRVEEEMEEAQNAVKILGGDICKVNQYKLPGTDIERSLVDIKKIKSTNNKYPRNPGKPVKKPLR